jgi:CDP-glucose 4,6-dehydratase
MGKQEFNRKTNQIGKVLLTGHTGFKGTWMTLLLESLGIEVVGLSLPPEPNSLFERLERKGVIEEYFFDINDKDKIINTLKQTSVKTVIHMAAQPLVLQSYQTPAKTFETNVMGTVNILDAAFNSNTVEAIIAVTTDKVYENKNTGRKFIESDSLFGKDPYSASKVGTESAIAAWSQISRINNGPSVISARAGNVIGGGDFAKDRIIPDLIRGYIKSEVVKVRSPKSTRPWQHALDPISGYLLAALDANETRTQYSVNFGPVDQSLEVQEVVSSAKQVFGEAINVEIESDGSSSMESHLLDLDSSFAQKQLGWKPVMDQKSAITSTFQWWEDVISKRLSAEEACNQDLKKFVTGHGFSS